ncbi:MAG: Asp-tRNA(Asn)/Glu-tRNA(Gln) amidotransferase subunit GatA [Rhizomicrobium sp.]
MAPSSNGAEFTVAEAREALRTKTVSAVELARACLDAMAVARPLNAFITETPERALAMAAESDRRIAAGESRPLEGVPLAIKDLFCTKDVRTTAASRMLENFVPAYESTVTQNLWNAGAVLLGKTNMDEFAMGSSNETSHFGPAINPWRARDCNEHVVPGGSSGGSAAAVAARLCLAATGTDTGGSIRQPAAVSGVVGVKPTYGRCSRWGIVAFASSLDQAGPITRTVRDAAILLNAMASYDPKDSTSIERPVPDYEHGLEDGVRGLRVGIPREYRIEGSPPEIEALWAKGAEWLRSQGAQIVDVSLPHTRYALPVYYIVAPAEASSNLARYDGVRYGRRTADPRSITELYERSRAEGFGAEVRRRILIGSYVLSAGYYDAYYLRAQKVRALIAHDFDAAFAHCDVLLAPSTPGPAFALGAKTRDPVSMYLNDVFTVPVSLAGLPAISVPAGLTEAALPLGLQVIGKAFDEPHVLRAGRALEQAAGLVGKPACWWSAP